MNLMIVARKSPNLVSVLSRRGVGFRAGLSGGFLGLGLTNPYTGKTVPPPAPGDCSGANGVPAQYSCSLYNQLAGPKYVNIGTAAAPNWVNLSAYPQYANAGYPIYDPSTDPNLWALTGQAQTEAAQNVAAPGYSPAPAAVPLPAAAASSSAGAKLSFTTSRGGNTVQPGDTWQVRITGAAPNSPVSVLGVHPDGGSATASEGSTDSSGNFSMSGSFDSSMIGTWKETWSVGGQPAGSFSFTVQAAAGAASGGGSSTAGAPAGGGTSAPASGFWTGSAFLGLPNWMLIGGGVAAAFAFSRSGGRR